MNLTRSALASLILIAGFTLHVAGCGTKVDETKSSASAGVVPKSTANVPSNPLKEAYFGETHIHTAYSLDAFLGGTRLTPSDAYRFAKGEAVTVNGQIHKIDRPLDFVAVTDHAEYLGEMYSTMVAGAPGYDQEQLKELRGLTDPNDRKKWFVKYVISNNRSATPQHPPFYVGPETTKSAWKVALAAADEHNNPGTSRPSLLSSGPQCQAGPIFTATSSSVTRMSLTYRSVLMKSHARKRCGNGWADWRRRA